MSSILIFMFSILASVTLLLQAGEETAWRYVEGEFVQVPAPAQNSPWRYPAIADADQDGIPERLALTGERAVIRSTGRAGWISPAGWQVLAARWSDLDHNGQTELALLIRRTFQPWPIDRYLPSGGRIANHQDRFGKSCHVILIGWFQSGYREIWAGSALAQPLRSLSPVDLDGDGREELLALESEYQTPIDAPASAIAVWAWNGFGFSLERRLLGTFRTLTLSYSQDGAFTILTRP